MLRYHVSFGLAVALTAICISTTEGVCLRPGTLGCLTNTGGAFKKMLLDALLERDTANSGDMILMRALELLLAEERAEGEQEIQRPPGTEEEQDRQVPLEAEDEQERQPPPEGFIRGFNAEDEEREALNENMRELLERLLNE